MLIRAYAAGRAGAINRLAESHPDTTAERSAGVGNRSQLHLASPAAVVSGYWDRCPYCAAPVFLPIAGGKESKAPVQCPSCAAAIRPDC